VARRRCGHLVAAGALGESASAKQRVIPRPVYKVEEARLETPFVVVHWVRASKAAVRLRDDDRDGVPNYVEKTANVANKAYLYYGHNGFKAPLPDSLGGNAKVDIYIGRLAAGVFGITIPTRYARGGAFMVLSNRLDMAHVARTGSLQQTVAHELFHIWQSSYVPSGNIPGWVVEGSATAMMTFVYPQIRDPAVMYYADRWLSEPWRSLYDQRRSCDHCYGGVLFWRFLFAQRGYLLADYFGRLYGYTKVGKRIGDATQPLDEILQKKLRSSLYEAYTRFSYNIYRAGYQPKPFYRLYAGTHMRRSKVRYVHGLSTHYVPVVIPSGTRGIALGVVTAPSRPNPEVKLVRGGPKGRVIEGVLRERGHVQLFSAAFRNARERTNALLIVTSGRKLGTAYNVTFQAV
jgi:hypothetical protein